MKWVVVIGISLLVVSMLWNIPATAENIRAQASGVIRINNDTELANMAASEGWAGNGTAGNPYIIENYTIDAQGNTSAIYIGNVSKYVIIRNCTVYNVTTVQTYGWGAGVTIYNTSNVVIENLTAHDVIQYGVYISSGSNYVVVKTPHFIPETSVISQA